MPYFEFMKMNLWKNQWISTFSSLLFQKSIKSIVDNDDEIKIKSTNNNNLFRKENYNKKLVANVKEFLNCLQII